MGATLHEKLSMPHLRNPEEIAVEVAEEVNGPKPEKHDPRAERTYTFQFRWEDPESGKTWAGQFTSKILNLGEQSLVGTLRARLAGGVPYESLDEFTKELLFLTAKLSYALTEKPDWAKNLSELDSFGLLQALNAEVEKHEATFRKRKPGSR